jgi:hypothetical protein
MKFSDQKDEVDLWNDKLVCVRERVPIEPFSDQSDEVKTQRERERERERDTVRPMTSSKPLSFMKA